MGSWPTLRVAPLAVKPARPALFAPACAAGAAEDKYPCHAQPPLLGNIRLVQRSEVLHQYRYEVTHLDAVLVVHKDCR